MEVDLIGVPYTSMAEPGGIANAIRVLREEGLVERVCASGDVRDAGDLALLEGAGVRGPSGLLNEGALAHLVSATRASVRRSLDRGRRPLLTGGDCPVLLGPLASGRDRYGKAGLLLIDGHEDAWPPHASSTGEASDSEVGIALGRVAGLPAALDELVPLLTPGALVMLGPRDRRELVGAGLESMDDTVALFLDDEAIRASGAARSARKATTTVTRGAGSFWLHVDLDVLRTEDFPAADYLQPGGLTWEELLDIAVPAFTDPHCFGCSVAIYNPELDPQRSSAARIVRFVSDLAASSSDTPRRDVG